MPESNYVYYNKVLQNFSLQEPISYKLLLQSITRSIENMLKLTYTHDAYENLKLSGVSPRIPFLKREGTDGGREVRIVVPSPRSDPGCATGNIHVTHFLV